MAALQPPEEPSPSQQTSPEPVGLDTSQTACGDACASPAGGSDLIGVPSAVSISAADGQSKEPVLQRLKVVGIPAGTFLALEAQLVVFAQHTSIRGVGGVCSCC